MSRIAGFVSLLLFVLGSARAQLPEHFHDEVFAGGFNFPTVITFDGTGRGYVSEKAGRVWILDQDGNKSSEPLIDIHQEVADWKDHGLMGFCLDNDFLENGYFYLLYAVDPYYDQHIGTAGYHPDSSALFQPTIGRVCRYTADPATNFTQVIADSRHILLGETMQNGIPLLFVYHGLGSLLMGKDGTLLISCGDATSNIGTDVGGDSLETPVSAAIAAGILTPDQDVGSYRSQYLGNYNGKVIRIDAGTGDGLISNPFFDRDAPRSARSRIWANGFRNPYRMTLRPNTGSHYTEDGQPGVLYIGDVGNAGWEEINIAQRGGENFGWPITEGLETNWAFFFAPRPFNQLAPNKAHQQYGCGEPFFTFWEVFARPDRNRAYIPNPCRPEEALSPDLFPAIESPPAIVWNNQKWNAARKSAVPAFAATGLFSFTELDDPACPVSSELFSGFSSIGGTFYENGSFPEAFHGKYFGADFSGWIRVFDFDDDQQLLSVEPFHDAAVNIIHLEANDVDGRLYYLNLDGEIRRISYGGNPAPVAVIEADHFYGPSPLTVRFDGTNSTDEAGPIVAYQWDFGDGSSSTDAQPSHVFQTVGTDPKSFTVRLTVTDEQGATQETTALVALNNNPPQAHISSIRPGERYPTQETTVLRLAAEVSDPEHLATDLSYEWRVFFHHNEHFHPEPADHNAESFVVINPVGCGQETYYYRIELTVSDPAGLSTHDQRILLPNCSTPFVGLGSLSGRVIDDAVSLAWRTDFEREVNEITIQRSADYFHFANIGHIDPQGATGGADYTFTDPEPIHGNNVYRIRFRQDSAYTYTNLATVRFPEPPAVEVYPNPAGDHFTVKVQRVKAATVKLELFDLMGRRIMSQEWEETQDAPSTQLVLTNKLAKGAYVYRVTNGPEEAVGRLLVR